MSNLEESLNACRVPGCGRPANGPLCLRHAESGAYIACDICERVAAYYDLLTCHGPSLGGWATVSEGPEEWCPDHRPLTVRPGRHATQADALAP